MALTTPTGEASSFSPLKLQQFAQDELLFTAFDSGEYNGVQYAVYFGTTGVTPTYAAFAKGCVLIQSTDATIYVNTAASLATPTWQLIGTSTPAALANGSIFIGNASNVPAVHALSGDVTITNAGVATIAALAVTAGKIAADAVTTAKILDANVTTAKIADNSVTGAKIAITSQATGSLMYYNGTDWINLGVGTNGQVLTVAGGVPTWA